MLKKNIFLLGLLVFNLIIAVTGIVFYLTIPEKIKNIARLLEETGTSTVDQNITVAERVYVISDFEVLHDVLVGVKTTINQTIIIEDTIHFKQKVMVPVALQINQTVDIDTVFKINAPVNITINDTIPLEQNITIKLGNIPVSIPVKTKIPINQDLLVALEQIPIEGSIPVSFEFVDTLPVELDIPVPVKMELPVNMKVNERAIITFFHPFSAAGDIPFELEFPVSLPLEHTQLKEKLDSVAFILRSMIFERK